MNPYQARKLAKIIHKDRARRIETILVRLTANGDLAERPTGGLHKVWAPNWVWCDVHGEAHAAREDIYEDNEDCVDENWRSVFVASTDPDEEF
jgi:hypothetical protein